jgi:competence protein ComEA
MNLLTAPFVLIAAVSLAFAADDEEAKKLPDGPGKDAVIQVCLSCHGTGNFRRLRLTKEIWAEKVADMIDRGAESTEAQTAAVVDYLTREFGKDSKIHINSAPFEELKGVLGLTTEETKAVLAYRGEKGDFKSWEELKNVPGVDAKKIENKKEIIAL